MGLLDLNAPFCPRCGSRHLGRDDTASRPLDPQSWRCLRCEATWPVVKRVFPWQPKQPTQNL